MDFSERRGKEIILSYYILVNFYFYININFLINKYVKLADGFQIDFSQKLVVNCNYIVHLEKSQQMRQSVKSMDDL